MMTMIHLLILVSHCEPNLDVPLAPPHRSSLEVATIV